MTTTTTHKRSVHIDVPVETVFDQVKDPQHFFEAFPEKDRSHMAVTEVELIPNERIVDHASVGGVWTCTFEPADPAGTTLSMAFGSSARPACGRGRRPSLPQRRP